MSTNAEAKQPYNRRVLLKSWALILLVVMLALSTLVLGIGYTKTQAELNTAENTVTSLEGTVEEQNSTIENFQADTQYWSVEEQNNVIAVAAAAVATERRGPGDDFEAYLFHIAQYGTDEFRNQISGTRDGMKTRGIVRTVDSADFSQPDKAVIQIGSSGVTGPRTARGFYTVTLVKADDGSILVDSFSGSTFQ